MNKEATAVRIRKTSTQPIHWPEYRTDFFKQRRQDNSTIYPVAVLRKSGTFYLDEDLRERYRV